MTIDGESACQAKCVLVLAADQRPFVSNENWFCVLQPLMTIDGERVDLSGSAFPNRGRIWWMLRDSIKEEEVVPGSIWTSAIEPAAKFDPADPKSEKYQVVRADIQPDGSDLVEIIDLPDEVPDLAIVTRGRLVDFPRKPMSRVFLRGGQVSLGPLKAIWHGELEKLELQPLSIGKPEVIRVSTEALESCARIEEFEVAVGQHDPTCDSDVLRIRLSRLSWLSLDQLRAAGEVLDASSDSQVIKWALKLYGVSRSKGQPIKAFFSEVAASPVAVDDDESQCKLARLQELAEDSERVLELGERVAAVLAAEAEDFKKLVESHIESLTATRVTEEVQRRRQQIEAAVADQRKQLIAVQDDLKRQQQGFEKTVKQQEEELRRREAFFLEEIGRREEAVVAREAAVASEEAEIHARLDQLIERYGKEADRLADDLLLKLPVLRKILGVGASGDAVTLAGKPPHDDHLNLPAYLHDAPPDAAAEQPSEEEFLRQLERVVQRRGFQFSADDLRNFHTCMKIGGLTVLAGPSGTGKSSLPQLYAEALGWVDRYLHVSVRPDWLDDRDFVGAYNPLVRRYEPSNSGVVDQLIAAALDQQRRLGGIYLIALDEMNLARVEHYFAQFLSILELPASKRAIPLFASGLVEASDPYHSFRKLFVGDNVRFVGTVNIDETTHFFSPKVLDRTQVVCLPPPDLTTLASADFTDPIPGITRVLFETYRQWGASAAEPEGVREFLATVSEALRDSRLGLRARQFNRILQYVGTSRDYLAADTALDYQIMQVVLPRLRRTAPRFDDSVAKLRSLVRPDRFPRSSEMLKRIAEPSIENDFFQLL